MSARADYLADVLGASPRLRLEHLFRIRKQLRATATAAHGGGLAPAAAPAPGAAGFLTTVQIEAALRRIEGRLFTAPIEENEGELLALAGKTDVHTRWWRRLHVANQNRPALEHLARRSPHWRAILGRIQEIVATPQASRDEARNRFLAEVTPILSPAAAAKNKAGLYELHQAYGGRAVFEALMSRLLIDAPEFHALEGIFFAHFNADAAAGLSGLRVDEEAPRARRCPVDADAPPKAPLRVRAVAILVYLGVVVFWIRFFFYR